MLKNLQSILQTARYPLMVMMCTVIWTPSFSIAKETNYSVVSQQEKTTLKEAMKSIEQKFGYTFAFNPKVIDVSQEVSGFSCDGDIASALKSLFEKTKIAYQIKGKQVILTLKVAFKLNAKIIDAEKKTPITGAMVVVKGTNNGSISNENGEVIINNVTTGEELEISFMGTKTKYVKLEQADKNLVIALEKAAINFESVIVTGYQTISKERATGSYDIIKSDDLDKPSSNIAQRLVGTTAGLVPTIDANNNVNFEIRGKTSLNSNSQPLIIVDGFAVEDGFNSVNPNDVENITILKDAAAASIWGARAGNGVIVITTKKAKQGKVSVDLSMFVKMSGKLDLDYLRPFASSSETVDFEMRAFKSNYFGGFPIKPDALSSITTAYPQAVSAMTEHRFGYMTEQERDAQLNRLRTLDNREQIKDYMLNSPLSQQYNLNISGGTDKMSNTLSLMYSDTESFFKFNALQDYLINYKTQLKVFKWLDFNFSGMFQYKELKDGGINAAEIGKLSPYEMLYNEDGSLGDITSFFNQPMLKRYVPTELFPYSDWSRHPVEEAKNVDLRTKNINARIQAGLTLNLAKGLSFGSSMQYEIFNETINNEYGANSFASRYEVNYKSSWDQKTNVVKANIPKGGMLDRTTTEVRAYIIRNQLNFSRKFNEKHGVDAIIGSEVLNRVGTSTKNPRIYGYDDERMTVGSLPSTINGLKNMMGGSYNIDMTTKFTYATDRFFSLYGNFSYNYDNRYTVSASIRTDASNFISDDPKYRYAPFWSVGGGWNLHNEKFFKPVEWADRLTLRFTYGYNGNVDKTTSFMPLITLGSSADVYSGNITGDIASYGNPDLRWEKIGTFNIGTDFTLLKGKLFGSLDFYNKKAKDLIVNVTMPSFNGTTTQKLNSGEMLNRGFEVTLGTTQEIVHGKVNWTGNLTFAYNKNKITKLFVSAYKASDLYLASTKSYIEGYDANTIWAMQYNGEKNYGTAEKPVMKPTILGKDGESYQVSAYPVGDGLNYVYDQGTRVAPYTASFSSSFKIYDFDFSFIVTSKFGHKFTRTGFNYPTATKLLPNKYLSQVVEGGADNFFQISDTDVRYSQFQTTFIIPYMSYLTENASHIRFQEINLTYNLPSKISSKIGISRLKVYAQMNNVGTILFNKYDEDPEYKYGTVRPIASYTLGLKLNF